jgi:hypothetical protein
MNTPYQFTRPGFEITEGTQWTENGENWRTLKVKWPKDIHTHSSEQTFYVNQNGFITRLDYRVEVAGNILCAHYLSDYKEVQGIKLATKRVVYLMDNDNKPKTDSPVVVSIDLSNIKFQ